jgi:hypothetical protein
MATYLELQALQGATEAEPLRLKIITAIMVKANTLAKATPTATQKEWAKSALGNPGAYVPTLLGYIIGEFNAVAIGSITGASDAQVQAAVDAAVNTLLGA